MALTIEEAREMARVAAETKRVLAVDSEHTAHGIWNVARQAVQAGVLGDLLWSQTSRSRNDRVPPWEYAIDKDISPRNLDWERFLGSAPKRPFDAERFFRWRRYWEYSGGLITDLFVHHITPLMKVTGPEFPVKAVTAGGAWHFPLNERLETPDTMVTAFDFPSGHTLMCGGSLANSIELPIVIRGHEANILFQGQNHLRPEYLVLEPEGPYVEGFREKVKKAGLEGVWLSEESSGPGYGQMTQAQKESWIASVLGEAGVKQEYDAELKRNPGLQTDGRLRESFFGSLYNRRNRNARQRPRLRVDSPPVPTFMEIFLECVRTRGKPALDAQLGYMVQVAVVMAVQSWRENKAVFFDPKAEKLVDRPVKG
jgi:predicted dehydrogenase